MASVNRPVGQSDLHGDIRLASLGTRRFEIDAGKAQTADRVVGSDGLGIALDGPRMEEGSEISSLPSAGWSMKFRRPMPGKKTPLWLWPNLLSLDAPLVAVAWLFMFAQAWQVNYLSWQSYLALALGVWVVYVLDKLLDRKIRATDDPLIGSRHEFHARHRKWFVGGVVVALIAIAAIVFTVLPVELLINYTRGQPPRLENILSSYAGPAILLVMAFFAMVLRSAESTEVPFFRNLVAGLAFGYGTAMMAHIYVPTQGMWSLLFSREMLGFAILCVLNITAIHLWEHSRMSDDPEQKAADELSLTLPLLVVGGVSLVFAYQDNPGMFRSGGGVDEHRPFFYAILVAAALLQVINRSRHRFSLDAQRTLADLAMVAPLPLFLIFSAG